MHEMHLRGILLLLCSGAERGDRLSDRRERFGGVGDAGGGDLHRAKPVAAAVDDMVCGRPCGGFDAVCSQHFACTDAHHIRRDRGNTHAHIEERGGTPHNAVHRGAAVHVGSRVNQGKQRAHTALTALINRRAALQDRAGIAIFKITIQIFHKSLRQAVIKPYFRLTRSSRDSIGRAAKNRNATVDSACTRSIGSPAA